MKKQLVIIGIIILLITVGLIGCTSNFTNTYPNTPTDTERDKFIGTWNGTYESVQGEINMTMILFSDGTYSFSYFYGSSQRQSGTWEIKDGKFVQTYLNMHVFSYSFSNGDKSLILNSIDTSEKFNLTKQ